MARNAEGAGASAATDPLTTDQAWRLKPEKYSKSGSAQALALNARRHEKNSLRGFFDLALPSGMIVKGCTLHVSHGRAWVAMPGRPYTDANGAQAWSNLLDFRDRATKERFQELAELSRLAGLARLRG